MKRYRIRCSGCGKSVSNEILIPDNFEVIIRAYIQCPECIEEEELEEEEEDRENITYSINNYRAED